MITRYWLGDTLFWQFTIEQCMLAQYQRCIIQLLKKLEFIQNISHKVVVVLSLVRKGQLKHFKEMYSIYPQCSCCLSCYGLVANIPIVFLEWNTLFTRKKKITIGMIHFWSLRPYWNFGSSTLIQCVNLASWVERGNLMLHFTGGGRGDRKTMCI